MAATTQRARRRAKELLDFSVNIGTAKKVMLGTSRQRTHLGHELKGMADSVSSIATKTGRLMHSFVGYVTDASLYAITSTARDDAFIPRMTALLRPVEARAPRDSDDEGSAAESEPDDPAEVFYNIPKVRRLSKRPRFC